MTRNTDDFYRFNFKVEKKIEFVSRRRIFKRQSPFHFTLCIQRKPGKRESLKQDLKQSPHYHNTSRFRQTCNFILKEAASYSRLLRNFDLYFIVFTRVPKSENTKMFINCFLLWECINFL